MKKSTVRTFILTVSLSVAAVSFAAAQNESQTALFAGGCFWSMEAAFEKTYGVISAESGYSGGTAVRPNYRNYAAGGHVETVRVVYDPGRISYDALLEVYWRHIDPTDAGGQFVDRGPGYRPVIFWLSQEQKADAEASRDRLERSKRFRKPIAVEIRKAGDFTSAEEYHQDYARLHPDAYGFYRTHSGRDGFFARIWGAEALHDPGAPPAVENGKFRKPRDGALKEQLSPLSFDVTQREGTEPPFANEYWNNHREGIYVDIVSGEPLFSSRDKFESGTGWPSFTRPLVPGNIVTRIDESYGMTRTEVRSKYADSHLGHLFHDGPAPTGLRYCMNSAALRFIRREDLEKEGYGRFVDFFSR